MGVPLRRGRDHSRCDGAADALQGRAAHTRAFSAPTLRCGEHADPGLSIMRTILIYV
jgi:hypothetical protein